MDDIMAQAKPHSSTKTTCVRWMWNGSANPYAESTPPEWCFYSDIENEIIEEAFIAGDTHARLDDYCIDFERRRQISNLDQRKQRPIRREQCHKNEKVFREDRFLPNPVAPNRAFGGSYGYISPFIKEVVKHLRLTRDRLSSKDESIVPMVVERAVAGLVEEGKKVGKKCEAKQMAKTVNAKKDLGMKEVWRCCAHLYTKESFLYRKMNEVMRLIGSQQHEDVWRSAISTLGPFCLLLWDNPFSSKTVDEKTEFFRGAKLPHHLVAEFQEECTKEPKPWHTFQAFTSCSRNREIAERFGNVLFIMRSKVAFADDLSSVSAYPQEEEQLLLPGVAFRIDRVEFDRRMGKSLIYLTLQQRHDRK